MSNTRPDILQIIQEVKEKRSNSIDLSDQSITEFPEEILELDWLEEIDLRNNKIEILPDSISKFKNLKKINLIGNPLTYVMNIFGLILDYSTFLKQKELISKQNIVGIMANRILPVYEFNHLLELTNLKYLNLRGNKLAKIPDSISNLINLVNLDISSNRLREFPENITNLTELTSLNIAWNGLTKLPESIRKLSNLTSLNLSNNSISKLPENLGKLIKLVNLDLTDNSIQLLPDSISKLRNLTSLNLSRNELLKFPENIDKLINLANLDLTTNSIKTIPDNICKLTHLTNLTLADNSIRILPDSFCELRNLTNLDLSSNQLQALPDNISKLKNLKRLDLNWNHLKNIPNSIGELNSLTRLNLNRSGLSELPECICRLRNLNYLNLSDNQLKELSIGIINLKNLTFLDLSRNRFVIFPDVLSKLTTLTELDLSGNLIKRSSENICNLINLQWLNLSNNNLFEFPENIFELPELISLDLSVNQLEKLPENICRLNKLSILNLRMNRLIELPDSINKFRNLINLNLGMNQLKELNESICRLTNLSRLDLKINKLTVLPENLGGLINLSALDLESNPITKLPKSLANFSDTVKIYFPDSLTSPPYEIAQQGIPVIRKYFEDLESQGEEFIYEAKLVIVGEPWAGKSTLAAKLLYPDAELTPYTDETMTRGIDILQWKFPFADNIEFTANVWDFAGQEILQSTHRYFLTKRTLYAIVIDTRPERDVLYDWLQNLKHFADHPPVVLILNERDDHRIEIPDSILNAFPFIKKPIYCVNFKTKRGLDDLIKGIQTELKTLPHIGKEPIPKNWVKLKTELEKITTDTIPVEDYFSLCAKIGNYSEEDARRISFFLHDLGYILHFQKDISLDNTVILNKQWATKAVYLVLDEKNKEKSEKFTVSDIRRIWKDYDKNRYSDLIQLMKNFLICYELNNQEYILPQLLSVNPPENYKWEYTDNLFFEFSYPEFMPKGLLPRFIVKIHQYIHKGIQWKTGVQLCYQNSFAEVIEDYPKRRIKIRISGKEKVEFLAIIRKEMDELHSFYLNLHVEPMIPCKCDGCKSSNEPHLFPYSVLKEYKKEKILKIRCGKHVKQEVEVLDLLEGFELDVKEDQSNYPLDKSGKIHGDFFEKIIEGLLRRVFVYANIEANYELKDKSGNKLFEYDFIVTSSDLHEIIVVEVKGNYEQKKISVGSGSEKQTIDWFFRNTYPALKNNYPNPHNYQFRACYITSAYFTDEANTKLKEYNKTKFKSSSLDVYYDRDKLFQLLKEKGMDKDIRNIKTHFKKQS